MATDCAIEVAHTAAMDARVGDGSSGAKHAVAPVPPGLPPCATTTTSLAVAESILLVIYHGHSYI